MGEGREGTGRTEVSVGDDVPDCNRANYSGCMGNTKAVGSYPAGSARTALGYGGNAWEWVYDWYDGVLCQLARPQSARTNMGQGRVLRGGSWYNDQTLVRSAYRYGPI